MLETTCSTFYKDGGLHRLVAKRNIRGIRQWLASPYRYVLNDLDHLGRTPLHIALMEADVSILSMLLHTPPAGCLPVTVDFSIPFDDAPALHLILLKAHFKETEGDAIECMRLIMEYFECPFSAAHSPGALPPLLLHPSRQTLDLNAADSAGCTALHRSSQLGSTDLCILLLAAGADIWKADENGDLAIHFAVDSLNAVTFCHLLEYMQECGIVAEDREGFTEVAWHILDKECASSGSALFKGIYAQAMSSNMKQNYDNLRDLLIRLERKGCVEGSTFWERVYATCGISKEKRELLFYMRLYKRCIKKNAWKCLMKLSSNKGGMQHWMECVDRLQACAAHNGNEEEFTEVLEALECNEIERLLNELDAGTWDERCFAKTHLFTHRMCLQHLPLPEPVDMPMKRFRLIERFPENPSRLEVLILPQRGIFCSEAFRWLHMVEVEEQASMADVLRVHDWGYIKKLKQKVQEAKELFEEGSREHCSLDADTPVAPESWNAALYAAGCVIAAVDSVCNGECRNAFCAVRPPGHHLGNWGAAQTDKFTEDDSSNGSQGFCLLNNVAIGASYAKYMYARRGINRIAIIDFDVHHGNGTEQIIRNTGPKLRTLKEERLLRMMGDPSLRRVATGIDEKLLLSPQMVWKVHFPCWMGWRNERDADDLFFASVHAYDGHFYPGTGRNCAEFGGPTIINVALPPETSSAKFRSLLTTRILRHLQAFNPDLIFISAGFDGHYGDTVSNGYTAYKDVDFDWATRQIVAVGNAVCNGRVISVLEGGYNTKLGVLSPFARSAAIHVKALHSTSPRCHRSWRKVDKKSDTGREDNITMMERYERALQFDSDMSDVCDDNDSIGDRSEINGLSSSGAEMDIFDGSDNSSTSKESLTDEGSVLRYSANIDGSTTFPTQIDEAREEIEYTPSGCDIASDDRSDSVTMYYETNGISTKGNVKI